MSLSILWFLSVYTAVGLPGHNVVPIFNSYKLKGILLGKIDTLLKIQRVTNGRTRVETQVVLTKHF